jgi:HemY protein
MLRYLVLLVLLFGIAFGLHRLRNLSGEVVLTLGETAYAVDLTTAIIVVVASVLVIVGVGWFLRELARSPWRFMRGWRRRNEDRGRHAISQGLLAVAAGDLRAADRAASEAVRRTPDLPLTRLLQAQAAQLKGDRSAARTVFQDMTEHPETRIAGLRGLHIEAEREGEHEAARQIAERAREEAPAAPWAARALLRHQTAESDWDGALRTLTGATDARILDKRTARRLRAVLLTAKARDSEDGAPDVARAAALEAHDLAPDLAPAAVVAGRLLGRQGDVRRAIRVLEATWKAGPHPEVADAYLHVRAGDAANDRLKRAETLLRLRSQDEGRHAVARAAIDARDFSRAREALRPILTERPTRKALILMAELEEAESGDSGRARGWLARAVHAPRDPAWTTDGMVLDDWAPASPVTGKLDTVEWKVPLAELEPPRMVIDAAELAPPIALESGTPEPMESAESKSGIGAAALSIPANEAGRIEAVEPVLSTVETPGQHGDPKRSVQGTAEKSAKVADFTVPADISVEPLRPPVPDDPGVIEEEDEDEAARRRAF